MRRRHRCNLFGFHFEPVKTLEDASDQFPLSLLQPGAHQCVSQTCAEKWQPASQHLSRCTIDKCPDPRVLCVPQSVYSTAGSAKTNSRLRGLAASRNHPPKQSRLCLLEIAHHSGEGRVRCTCLSAPQKTQSHPRTRLQRSAPLCTASFRVHRHHASAIAADPGETREMAWRPSGGHERLQESGVKLHRVILARRIRDSAAFPDCASAVSGRLRQLRGMLQCGHADLHVLDLDRLLGVIQNAVGSANTS